jgi:hypothetical protein
MQMQREGRQLIGNKLFRSAEEKKSEISGRDLQNYFGEFKIEISFKMTNTKSPS